MLIDMHNHTNISSPCSLLSPEELIETARLRGADAVCVTEHSFIEGANLTQEIGRKLGYPVFRGIEARSALGDMLVFGYYNDIHEGISLSELCRHVHDAGGVVFAAHPYHTTGGWNLYSALRGMGKDPDRDWENLKILRELDGIETINGHVSEETNAKAGALADRLGIPGIGGSDAHAAHMVGRAATRFECPIRSEEELVKALKRGGYTAVMIP